LEAYANLQNLRARYPDIYAADGGFYDAVNPKTGSVGHRRLVLDQSMIMAGLDDAPDRRAAAVLRKGSGGLHGQAVPGLGAHVDPLTGHAGARP
jgi:hypothetical protein